MVVFGRPKGYRGSYKQWEEGGIAPQVVFEVLSPGNTRREMARKWAFYDQYGVEEYYIYDPDHGTLEGWLRPAAGGALERIGEMRGWESPRLGVRFDLEGIELVLTGPDGRRFASYAVVARERELAERRAETQALERRAAEERAEAERQARLAAEQRLEQLAARLRELGADPDVTP